MNINRKTLVLTLLVVSLMVSVGLTKVYAAETVTVKGEIIDTYCYALMGAKGEGHRQCAIDCIKAGIPAGLENPAYRKYPSPQKTAYRNNSSPRWAGHSCPARARRDRINEIIVSPSRRA